MVSFQGGPEAAWQLLSYEFTEALNGRSELTLELAAETLPELGELLGSSVELSMQRPGALGRSVYAVVLGVDFRGHAEHRGLVRVHGVSAFELAEYRRHSRIWQETSVIDIVTEVLDAALGDYGRTLRCDVHSRGTSPRRYCVQYRESDYDFVRRLLEEEGINYYWNHDLGAGHEVLVLCETNDQYPAAENVDGGPNFPLITGSPELTEFESLQGLEWSQRLTSTKVLRRDYDWRHPTELLTTAHGEGDPKGIIRQVYSHSHRRFEQDDLELRSVDLSEALAQPGNMAWGQSNAVGLRPGLRFTTDAHSADGVPHDYIVLEVRHHGGPGYAGSLGTNSAIYTNEFQCVPFERPIRPLLHTPKPYTRGPQTATVVGDGEIHTDEYGRIQVQFHWQEEPSYAADASCWVRCAQSWAAGGWGAQFIPRVGMEVVVEFLDGNPDRPLVTGCVYNGAHEPPFSLPDNVTQSGWRTNSSPGGSGSNELRFEDAAGAEEIYIHGQKDWLVEINNDTSKSTGNDEILSVGRDRSKTVGNNQSEDVGVDKTICVGSNHRETIGAAMSLDVGTDQTVTIGVNQTIGVGADLSETVGANMTQAIGANASQTVGAAKSTTVTGLMSVTVGGMFNTMVGGLMSQEIGGLKTVAVGGMSTETVVGNYGLSAANISGSARTNVGLDAGSNFSAQAGSNVDLASGAAFNANAGSTLILTAADKIELKCGSSSLTLESGGKIVLKGSKVTVEGSSSLVCKAKKIHQN
ncbi:VgrG protein [Enhygromyxa salina]|uniref:VgrG protein n=1 Tax=Enhygromyxa salina TaxID=215803 RepID=A0A0C2CYB5_9BACT|nr:type VI secretion system tip protein TssI/VgrG [Enhygromyxa salina]KIG12822.1 VgrG protein [Enhygromyxa salina]